MANPFLWVMMRQFKSGKKLLVFSFSGLGRSIRMEGLRAGRTVSGRYCNRRIGKFLKEPYLTESRSSGIPKGLCVMRPTDPSRL